MLKINRIMKIMGIGTCCLFLLGCTKESFLIQKEDSSTIVLEETIAGEEIAAAEDKQQTSEQEFAAGESRNIDEYTVVEENIASEETQEMIAVHICGAVNQPGVYYLNHKQRVYEGILKAGGFREDADRDYLNQALFLEDGMKITVPTKEETKMLKASAEISGEERFIQEAQISVKSEEKLQKVDLNTADEALLCTLPGIGKSRAQSILAYRKEHGAFGRVEDIMKVSGIKEAAYEKIKDYIVVSQ